MSIFNRSKVIYFIGVLLLLSSRLGCAQTVVITGQKIIDKPTAYRNVILDLSHGSFLVMNNAWLELSNTVVNGVISQANPFLIRSEKGRLLLRNNVFNVTAGPLPVNPLAPPSYQVIKIIEGQAYIVGNRFTVDQPYTVGLLFTDHFATSGFIIRGNKIHNFHGGFFLTYSQNALVEDNDFSNVSLSNIFTQFSSNNIYRKNSILYSGNNGFDIIDSNHITLRENYVSLSSCYSVLILRSQDLLIDQNQVIGGVTYAVFASSALGKSDPYSKHLWAWIKDNLGTSTDYKNSNITITNNYFGQNRYGITTNSLDGLTVKNNVFIQKFWDAPRRRYWTDNTILLRNTIHISWENNFYKEAFTQAPDGNNEDALKRTSFPPSGGVVL